MKAIKHDKVVAALTSAGVLLAITGLVVSGLNKSEREAVEANAVLTEKTLEESSNLLSLDRMDQILVGATLDDFYSGVTEITTAEKVEEKETTKDETETKETETQTQPETEEQTTEEYAYADFFLVNVDEYLNVRSEGSENGEILGKIYAGGGGRVLEAGTEWSKIQSGNVIGYINNSYAWFAHDAEANIPNVCEMTATSTADTLRLRKGPGTDYGVEELVDCGTQVTVMAVEGDWVTIRYNGKTLYAAKEYISMQYEIGEGITIEEEQAIIAAEAERIAAEAAAEEERKRQNMAKAKITETVYSSAYAMSAEDTYLLACLVMSEAGGEPYEGKLAVANIVLNRLNSGKYGNTISDVIYASGQFSVVRNGALDRAIQNGPNAGSVQAAQEALSGTNNVSGYTSFCTVSVAKYGRYQEYSIIGNQVFYR